MRHACLQARSLTYIGAVLEGGSGSQMCHRMRWGNGQQSPLRSARNKGVAALALSMLAFMFLYLATTKSMLGSDADPSRRDKPYPPPLPAAARLKHTGIVRLQVENGYNLASGTLTEGADMDRTGRAAWHLSAQYDVPASVPILLNLDTETNAGDDQEGTPVCMRMCVWKMMTLLRSVSLDWPRPLANVLGGAGGTTALC